MYIRTSSAASSAANCVNIWLSGFLQTFARTLRRPLCGIPMTMDSTPSSVDLSITCFIAGIRISQPSSPNLFSEVHFLAKNASNLKSKKQSAWRECFKIIKICLNKLQPTQWLESISPK